MWPDRSRCSRLPAAGAAFNRFNVSLVGIGKGPVAMRSGFMVEPKYTIHTVPHIDVLLIPGGYRHPTRAR